MVFPFSNCLDTKYDEQKYMSQYLGRLLRILIGVIVGLIEGINAEIIADEEWEF